MRAMDDSFDTVPTSPDVQSVEPGGDEVLSPLLIAMSGKHLGEFHVVETVACLIGRSSEADVRFDDEGVSRRHAIIRHIDDAYFVEDLESANGTFVNGEPVQFRELEAGDRITLGRSTILKFLMCDPLDAAFHRRLLEAALRDGLTQVHNKRYIVQRAVDELAFARRHSTPLSVLFIDLDAFKPINDNYGHLVGDDVLVGVARMIDDSARREDVVGRYGGDEFVILCRNTGPEGATQLAERLRTAIEGATFKSGTHTFKLTASIGVSSFPALDVEDASDLIAAADRALYSAKDAGRNRVVFASGDESER